MRDSAIISFALAQAWGLHEPIAERFVDVLNAHAEGWRVSADELAQVAGLGRERAERNAAARTPADGRAGPLDAEPAAKRPPFVIDGSVAIVPVEGFLCKYASMVNGISQPQGMTSDEICRAVEGAAKARGVTRVVLQVDSPGGTVAGVDDVVECIHAVRDSGMPVIGYAHDLGASCAYRILAACQSIYANSLATVGSIGIMRVVRDTSAWTKESGVRMHVLRSGPRKAIGTPGIEITPDDLAVMQSEIDAMARVFISGIADDREWNDQQVARNCDGGVFNAVEGVQHGLVDRVIGFRDLIATLNQKRAPHSSAGM